MSTEVKMNLLNTPKPETFQYGFLTSRTARILNDYASGVQLDEERRRLLEQADKFMESLLNGEALVSGDKDNIAPSIEALEIFHYGVNALSVMEGMHIIARPENRHGIRDILSDIRQTLSAVRIAPPNEDDMAARVEQAARFFDVIADALLNEALECSHAEPSPVL
jgi:hypothetical protein